MGAQYWSVRHGKMPSTAGRNDDGLADACESLVVVHPKADGLLADVAVHFTHRPALEERAVSL